MTHYSATINDVADGLVQRETRGESISKMVGLAKARLSALRLLVLAEAGKISRGGKEIDPYVPAALATGLPGSFPFI